MQLLTFGHISLQLTVLQPDGFTERIGPDLQLT
jgi:hypothetical protein